ncbi:MAG TPA: ATP:cob(I)alamin adenosyltransferase [Candidatus Paceibacterota bacterium]
MALFTGKGDDGTTKTFGCNQRISKSSAIAEALGSLDEINSFLGLCKVQASYLGFQFEGKALSEIVHSLQKTLFVVQAELAGAEKTVSEQKVKEIEEIINDMERKMPPIKSFFISGGPEGLRKDQMGGVGLGALFDIARSIARRAERRVTQVAEEEMNRTLFEKDFPSQSNEENKPRQIGAHTRAFLNRLSSILYALARYSNHLSGIVEEAPDYR